MSETESKFMLFAFFSAMSSLMGSLIIPPLIYVFYVIVGVALIGLFLHVAHREQGGSRSSGRGAGAGARSGARGSNQAGVHPHQNIFLIIGAIIAFFLIAFSG